MRYGISSTVGFGEGNAEIKTINNDKFVGEVYFEVHSDRIRDNNIKVELYGNSNLQGISNCDDTGVVLAKGTFSSRVFAFPSYNDVYRERSFECQPRSSGAVMAAAEFTIYDPYGTQNAQSETGQLLYCVRVVVDTPAMSPSEDSTFIDTKFEITGELNTESMDAKAINDAVRIFSNQPIDSKKAYIATQSVEVEVKAFLCNIPDGTSTEGNLQLQYGIGQTVSICVGPTGEYADKFEVTGFDSISCANKGQTRKIVEGGETDFATNFKESPTGYIDVLTGKTIAANTGVMAVQTKVTTGLIQLGDTFMTCSGEAIVESKSDNRRLTVLERETLGGTNAPFAISVGLTNEIITTSSSGSKPLFLRRWILGSSLVVAVAAAACLL